MIGSLESLKKSFFCTTLYSLLSLSTPPPTPKNWLLRREIQGAQGSKTHATKIGIQADESKANEKPSPQHTYRMRGLGYRSLTQLSLLKNNFYLRAESCSLIAAIFASASRFLFCSFSTTWAGADDTKRSLESFFITVARKPSL